MRKGSLMLKHAARNIGHPIAYNLLFGYFFHPNPWPFLLWVKYLRNRMLIKRCNPLKALLAFVCLKYLTHPHTIGLICSTNVSGLIGAFRDVQDFSLLRMLCCACLEGCR